MKKEKPISEDADVVKANELQQALTKHCIDKGMTIFSLIVKHHSQDKNEMIGSIDGKLERISDAIIACMKGEPRIHALVMSDLRDNSAAVELTQRNDLSQ